MGVGRRWHTQERASQGMRRSGERNLQSFAKRRIFRLRMPPEPQDDVMHRVGDVIIADNDPPTAAPEEVSPKLEAALVRQRHANGFVLWSDSET